MLITAYNKEGVYPILTIDRVDNIIDFEMICQRYVESLLAGYPYKNECKLDLDIRQEHPTMLYISSITMNRIIEALTSKEERGE